MDTIVLVVVLTTSWCYVVTLIALSYWGKRQYLQGYLDGKQERHNEVMKYFAWMRDWEDDD